MPLTETIVTWRLQRRPALPATSSALKGSAVQGRITVDALSASLRASATMQAHRFPLLLTHFVAIPFDAPLLPFAFGARLFPMDFLWLFLLACWCGAILR